MDRNRKLRWISLSLAILAVVLLFIDVYSGHIERSMSLAVLAIVTAVFGTGLDLRARSSPGRRVPVVDARKHPVLMNVAFFGTLLLLSVVLVYTLSSEPHLSWRRELLTPLISVLFLVGYNLLIAFVRHIRTRMHNSTNN